MTWAPTTPVTGGAATGFTSPTYTIVLDRAPDYNGYQNAVTALGGTQTGVRVHAVSDPFTVTVSKPKQLKMLPSPNPVTGKYNAPPVNTYVFLVRKGVNFAANNAPVIASARCEINIPAGTDAYDPANIRAMISCLVGVLSQQSAGFGDTLVQGIL
jgi:hypothetical protein